MKAQKATRKAFKQATGSAPGMDYTDFRSPDALYFSGRELRGFHPTEADHLFVGGNNKRGYYSERDANSVTSDLQHHYGVATTPVETAPGQWKLRVDAVPPPVSEKDLRGVVGELHEAALRGEILDSAVGIVGPEEAARVKAATGQNVLLHRRTMSGGDVMHAMDRHNKQAPALGEELITHADIARYPEVVGKPDRIIPGTRPNSIIYEKRFPDGTLYVAEQALRGNNIEFKTMFKNKVAERMRRAFLLGAPARGAGRSGEEE